MPAKKQMQNIIGKLVAITALLLKSFRFSLRIRNKYKGYALTAIKSKNVKRKFFGLSKKNIVMKNIRGQTITGNKKLKLISLNQRGTFLFSVTSMFDGLS